MKTEKLQRVVWFTVAVVAVGAASVGLTRLTAAADSAWERNGLLAGMLVSAGAGVILLLRRQQQRQQLVQRYVELLAHLDEQLLADGGAAMALPEIDIHSPWRKPLDQLRQRLADVVDRAATFDLTRAALELRLRRAQQYACQIEGMFEALVDPILAIDSYNEIVAANAAACELLGIHPEVGDQVRSLEDYPLCQPLFPLVHDLCRRQLAASRSVELMLTDAQGVQRWFEITARTCTLGDAELHAENRQGVVLVLHSNEQLKAVRQNHAEFVSAVSHEMKTPLAGIKAYVEMLADGDAEDQATQEQFLEVINSQADRLQRLIENLLNLARIEAGAVQVSKRHQSINEILHEAAHLVVPSAEAKQIQLVHDLSPLYLGAQVDRDMLLQAVINLLSNAIKYTPPGGRVVLRSRLDDDAVHVEVEDSGVGLSEIDCQRVFDRFYRVEHHKQMAPGTGLGLPLARHIVEDVHGGRLQVRSRLGEGSTFAISIPSHGRGPRRDTEAEDHHDSEPIVAARAAV